MYAASCGQYGVMQKLISAGADVNAKCVNGETPLMNAASVGNVQIIKLLLEKGANVQVFDSLGENALYHAVFRRNNIQLLLYSYAYVNSAGERGYEKCLMFLLEAGADVNSSPKALIVAAVDMMGV